MPSTSLAPPCSPVLFLVLTPSTSLVGAVGAVGIASSSGAAGAGRHPSLTRPFLTRHPLLLRLAATLARRDQGYHSDRPVAMRRVDGAESHSETGGGDDLAALIWA